MSDDIHAEIQAAQIRLREKQLADIRREASAALMVDPTIAEKDPRVEVFSHSGEWRLVWRGGQTGIRSIT